jgi:hypothetical protein
MNKELQILIDQYGAATIVEAVKQLTGKHIPKTATSLVDDDKLQASLYQLDTGVGDILAAGTAVETAYQDKAELMKCSRQLETEIQLTEAGAIMEIQGTGKDAFAVVDGKKIVITNDQSRDAYRHTVSRDLRTEKATIDAAITKLDIDIIRAKDAYNAKLEAFHGIRVKANLQAAVLNSLA